MVDSYYRRDRLPYPMYSLIGEITLHPIVLNHVLFMCIAYSESIKKYIVTYIILRTSSIKHRSCLSKHMSTLILVLKLKPLHQTFAYRPHPQPLAVDVHRDRKQ